MAITFNPLVNINPITPDSDLLNSAPANPIRGTTIADPINFKYECNPVYMKEQHTTVIRRGPTMPPLLEMYSWDPNADINNDQKYILEDIFYGGEMLEEAIDGSPVSLFYDNKKNPKGVDGEIYIPIDLTATFAPDWQAQSTLIIEHEYIDSAGANQTASMRVLILSSAVNHPDGPAGNNTNPVLSGVYIKCKILSLSPGWPITPDAAQIFKLELVRKNPIFEFKFPKFAYRYQYEDGEYSVFSPWSEIAFIPEDFDYLPKKGYNLGMTNNIRQLKILNWRPKNIPKDVTKVDILYKESNSPNIYTVESFSKTDPPPCTTCENPWNIRAIGDHFGSYSITSELIHQVVASNQLLRPWDNVPRMALGQEMSGNRLIYGNYLQNYNLLDYTGNEIKAKFEIDIRHVDHSVSGSLYNTATPFSFFVPKKPMKSLKSMRNYQVGVIYRDRYGRETPILTSESGAFEVPRSLARYQNKLVVKLTNDPPAWAESYTFYIKETSNEYYNVSMDRWYDAEDGNVWLSFPSSERNKINDDTVLVLKKQHDNDTYVDSEVKYRILAIENDAPDFIKTDTQYWGSLPMMLPPAGWGVGGRPGGWDSGMFYSTGLPLPERLFIDIYAEYFDQSVLFGLKEAVTGRPGGAQIRVVQSHQSSAYVSFASDTLNKSKWYDISKVNYIGSPPKTYIENTVDANGNPIEIEVEEPGQEEQIVRITLEQMMGNDLDFCKPTDHLSLSRGLSIEARAKTVRERPQFQGRFFVKILRDADLETHVVEPQARIGDAYQVLMAKKLKYICMAHPGVQDWRTDNTGTYGTALAVKGKWNVPGEVDGNTNDYQTVTVNYLQPAADVDAPGGATLHESYNNFGQGPFIKRRVSSLSHTAGEASYVGVYPLLGNIPPFSAELPPQSATTTGLWPIGPGWHSSHVYDIFSWTNPWPWFRHTYERWITGNGCQPNGKPWFTTASEFQYPWPAFMPDQWHPNTLPLLNNIWGAGGLASIPDPSGPQPWTTGAAPPPYPSEIWYANTYSTCTGSTTVNDAEFNGGLLINLPNNTNTATSAMNPLPPANPYQIPEIWGNQEDFFNRDIGITEDTVNQTMSLFYNNERNHSVFNKDTIYKLRQDWYYLYNGKQLVCSEWPDATLSSERWFIDKVGAAKGYSGNGMWEETIGGNVVTKMHISFYGIGDPSGNNKIRSHNLNHFQESEDAFAEYMNTTGTQFRYRSDPDQIVYTITHVDGPELVYNYEAPHGTWGHEDPDSTGNAHPDAGVSMGKGKMPPYGPIDVRTNSIALKDAFISDMFALSFDDLSEKRTGGYLANYRVRYTITLDKKVGVGVTGFHPLKKHIDENGDCNIEDGPQYYLDPGGPTVTEWLGGYNPKQSTGGLPTAPGVRYYNLSSFFNHSAVPSVTIDQDHTDGVGNASNMTFGLHERGLNSTWIEIVTPYKGDEVKPLMSGNPAIFETEPREDIGLDIYYAASPTYPINLKRFRYDTYNQDPIDFHWNPPGGALTLAHWHDYGLRGEEYIPIGAKIKLQQSGSPTGVSTGATCYVIGIEGNRLWVSDILKQDVPGGAGVPAVLDPGDLLEISWQGEGNFYGGQEDAFVLKDIIVEDNTGPLPDGDIYSFYLNPNTHNNKIILPYFNCYTFANGVESNRIRDDYNAVTIDKGVKASMPLAEKYMEERRSSSLIFSGIYNSTSGINRLNQFILAEPITKDINPIHGSIQKLFSRDTDLVTFCENKVFKVLAQKDALFNADGSTNVTATQKVLGQAIPFVGEFGISKNPESLAQQSYRLYFSDKTRGAILRLSRDGLTPISDYGMKDWFKDYLRNAETIIGSYDNKREEYNVSLKTKKYTGDDPFELYTLSYSERNRGWVSFKSFVHQGGISIDNKYYTFPFNNFSNSNVDDPWGVGYSGIPNNFIAEVFEHGLDLEIKYTPDDTYGANAQAGVAGDDQIYLDPSSTEPLLVGMCVEGIGIPPDTYIVDIEPDDYITVSTDKFSVDLNTELTFTNCRNTFYSVYHPSMIKVLFNGEQSSVKDFKTLNYEGTQARIDEGTPTTGVHSTYQLYGSSGTSATFGKIYRDNISKKGWYVENLFTDLQKGSLKQFTDKENKWFDYIRGYQDVGLKDDIDTREFPLQGLGFVLNALVS